MNNTVETIRFILSDVRPQLMKKQNVVATGIGFKSVQGKSTQDLSIICSVDVKVAKEKLSSQQIIPTSFQGIPTDINPTGLLRAFQSPTQRFRPAPGGVSIGHFQITAGTLGCLVRKNGEVYILSNNHVLANSNGASPGDAIIQPGSYDGGQNPQDKIATLSEFIPIVFEGEGGDTSKCRIAGSVASFFNLFARLFGSKTRLQQTRILQTENKVDCAIGKPVDENDVLNEILGIGQITGVQDAELGMAIKKSGRTTGFTTGSIQQIDVTSQVSYGTNKIAVFTDQLMAGAMSQGGDSGSAILNNDNKLVGLLFAGSDTTTIINRIGNVFSALGVELP